MSAVNFEGVTFQVPEGVTFAVENGKLTLSFVNFSGAVSMAPRQASPGSDTWHSSQQQVKRARFDTPDEVLGEGQRGGGSSATAQQTEIFRNGGLSQEDSESGSQAPEPRSISWDDIVMDRDVEFNRRSSTGGAVDFPAPRPKRLHAPAAKGGLALSEPPIRPPVYAAAADVEDAEATQLGDPSAVPRRSPLGRSPGRTSEAPWGDSATQVPPRGAPTPSRKAGSPAARSAHGTPGSRASTTRLAAASAPPEVRPSPPQG
eukprot:4777121-Prymnesium_polylepis.1